MAHSSLRFGIGRFTTEAEIDFVVEKIAAIVQRLRDMRYAILFTDKAFSLKYPSVHYGRWYKKELTSVPSTGHSTKPENDYSRVCSGGNFYTFA